MHPYDWFAERLEVARRNDSTPGSRDIHANCPVCGSSDALHVTEKNGKALIRCFSCEADYAKVVDALDAAGDVIAPTITRVKRDKTEIKREAFVIRDADGTAVTTHTRIDYADGSKNFFWPKDKGTKPATLPLYGSEDVASFDRAKPVVVTEGERKRDRLKDAGFQSVALVGGSSVDPSDASLSVLRGYDVVLWPDNDVPGRKVMDYVARALIGLGTKVRVVAWGGAPEKGDAADLLDAYVGTSLGVDICGVLIDSAKPWESSEPPLILSIHDVSDDPPKPLLLDRLEPEDHTILFGDGGTGKGVIAAWWVARLTRDHGMRVLILDYEAHARYEWKPRLRQMGGDLDLVFISQPEVAIWDAAKQLREEMLGLAIDYVVVDSVTYACIGQEVEKSATAVKYSATINSIGFPTLSLAHTTKTDADPKHPFGSVFWSNGARMTIGVVAREDGRLIQAKKVNARAAFAPQVIDWKWASELGPSEVPSTLDERPEKVAISPRIAVALASGPMTIAELVVALEADGGGVAKAASIKAALERGDEFKPDGKKPATWSLFNPTVKRTSRAKVVAIGGDE